MNYENAIEKFFRDNVVNYHKDKELCKYNKEMLTLFLKLSQKTNEENKEMISKIIDVVYSYLESSNKKNFYTALNMGIYINKYVSDDGE